MSRLKRYIGMFLFVIIFTYSLSSVSHATGISPRWDNTKTVQMGLSFSNNQATCSLYISGKAGTSRIKGTLTLRDTTSDKNVNSWSFDTKESFKSVSQKADVTSGHTYTLSFSGYVYNADGVGEHVSATTTKQN